MADRRRPDVLLDVSAVGLERALVEFSHLQVTVGQLTHSGVGMWVASIIDLDEEPRTGLLGLTICSRSCGDRFTKVAVTPVMGSTPA